MAVAENKSPGWVGEMCFVSNVARVASKNASSREELAERVRSHESEMRRRMCTCAPAVPVEVDKETTGSLVRWVRTLATELKAVDPCAPDILSATTDAEVAEQLAAPAQLLQIDPASEVASASASAAGAPSLALARDLRQLLAEVSRRRALAAQLTEKLGSLVRQLVSTTAGKGNAKLCWLCGLPPLLAAVILSDPRHTHLVSSLMTDRANHGAVHGILDALELWQIQTLSLLVEYIPRLRRVELEALPSEQRHAMLLATRACAATFTAVDFLRYEQPDVPMESRCEKAFHVLCESSADTDEYEPSPLLSLAEVAAVVEDDPVVRGLIGLTGDMGKGLSERYAAHLQTALDQAGFFRFISDLTMQHSVHSTPDSLPLVDEPFCAPKGAGEDICGSIPTSFEIAECGEEAYQSDSPASRLSSPHNSLGASIDAKLEAYDIELPPKLSSFCTAHASSLESTTYETESRTGDAVESAFVAPVVHRVARAAGAEVGTFRGAASTLALARAAAMDAAMDNDLMTQDSSDSTRSFKELLRHLLQPDALFTLRDEIVALESRPHEDAGGTTLRLKVALLASAHRLLSVIAQSLATLLVAALTSRKGAASVPDSMLHAIKHCASTELSPTQCVRAFLERPVLLTQCALQVPDGRIRTIASRCNWLVALAAMAEPSPALATWAETSVTVVSQTVKYAQGKTRSSSELERRRGKASGVALHTLAGHVRRAVTQDSRLLELVVSEERDVPTLQAVCAPSSSPAGPAHGPKRAQWTSAQLEPALANTLGEGSHGPIMTPAFSSSTGVTTSGGWLTSLSPDARSPTFPPSVSTTLADGMVNSNADTGSAPARSQGGRMGARFRGTVSLSKSESSSTCSSPLTRPSSAQSLRHKAPPGLGCAQVRSSNEQATSRPIHPPLVCSFNAWVHQEKRAIMRAEYLQERKSRSSTAFRSGIFEARPIGSAEGDQPMFTQQRNLQSAPQNFFAEDVEEGPRAGRPHIPGPTPQSPVPKHATKPSPSLSSLLACSTSKGAQLQTPKKHAQRTTLARPQSAVLFRSASKEDAMQGHRRAKCDVDPERMSKQKTAEQAQQDFPCDTDVDSDLYRNKYEEDIFRCNISPHRRPFSAASRLESQPERKRKDSPQVLSVPMLTLGSSVTLPASHSSFTCLYAFQQHSPSKARRGQTAPSHTKMTNARSTAMGADATVSVATSKAICSPSSFQAQGISTTAARHKESNRTCRGSSTYWEPGLGWHR